MFSLGLFGILLIAAVPLLAIYAFAGLALKIAVVVTNHSSAPVSFDARNGSVISISLFAWLASVVLFGLCGALNYWFTQYSGDTILRLYPLLQLLASFALFYGFLVNRVSTKRTAEPTTAGTRRLWTLLVSVVPTILQLAAGNVWHLSRGTP
ncbi:hypothetical protein GL58_10805 [Comamonas testosteroni]|uniref:Uncharacterized protein n=1 Tax=Comamonas testosteroni TaxID=285 RepID=A0A0L7MG04_COMTE|nr:hypothetical protein [Comamonas testosteroni]KOC20844.1 hypothetical protein GL58_10805 [Comamonas testosteroni]